MINVAFNGNIYDKDDTLTTDVAYRLYFKSNNTNSSSSRWSNIRYTETNLHQYNINLGDPDLLGNDGSYNVGDEVLILYWIPMQSSHVDFNLTQWSTIHYTLDGSQTYPQDVQILNHYKPTCSFTTSGSYVNEPMAVINIDTTDNYYWVFSNKDHFQECDHFGITLFNMNCLQNDCVEINWGDGSIETGLNLLDSPFNHTYTQSGDYDIYVTVNNTDLLECNQQLPVHITYRVYNGLTWNEPVYLDTSNTYTPAITGSVERISSVDYYINNVLTYTGLDWNESFDHTFTTVGPHVIKQCINYNDGFENKIQCEEYIVNLSCIAHYNEYEYECGLVFVSDSKIGSPPVVNYQWDVTHLGEVIAHIEGLNEDRFYYSFPYTGTFRVRLQISDQYSISSYEKEFEITECPCDGKSDGGSSGGGSSPWIYQEYKEYIPVIKIVDIECKDINKKILILDIKEMD
jgi:hypothetical protein